MQKEQFVLVTSEKGWFLRIKAQLPEKPWIFLKKKFVKKQERANQYLKRRKKKDDSGIRTRHFRLPNRGDTRYLYYTEH